jgi:hypothetical protein
VVQGSLNSAANTTFRIEFFANNAADPTGYGQGQTYLGYVNVTTDDSGNVSFLTGLSINATPDSTISATTTNLTTNNTSEFAQNILAKSPGVTVTPAGGLTTTEDGGSMQFSVVLHAVPISDVTIPISPDDATEGAVSVLSLTFTPANWNISQTVTVTGLLDYITDGDVPYKIVTGPAESGDANYQAIHGTDLSLVNIDHVNLPPALTAPGKQSAGLSLIFSTTTGNAIRVQDPDSTGNALHVTLSATNGQMTLANTSGLTFLSGNGNGNATVEFTGSSASINAALEGMRFNPSDTACNLQISVDDQGFSGSGGVKMAEAFVDITAATPKRASLPTPVLPPAPPSPTPPHSVTPPSNPQSYYSDQFYVSLMRSLEQTGKIIHADSSNGGKAIASSIINTLLTNASPADITSVDVNNDYSASHDRYQNLAIQPFISKLGNGTLSLQSVMDTQLILKEMKAIVAQGNTLPWLSKINVGTAIGLGAGLSAGYIMMALRWGALLTSGLATTFPVWQWIDPLPILETSKHKSGNQKSSGENGQNANPQLDESLETLMT